MSGDGLEVHRAWAADDADEILTGLRACFTYGPGDDRASGYLYDAAQQPWPGHHGGDPWPGPLEPYGPGLLGRLYALTGVRFTIVAFQAYRDGSGCGWHADTPFGVQAIVSLGVTRTFGLRRTDGSDEQQIQVGHGDLVVMPDGFQAGWEHRVPVEDVPGERCSLVFRIPAACGAVSR